MSAGHGARWAAVLGPDESPVPRLRNMVSVAEILPANPAQKAWHLAHPGDPTHSVLAWPNERLRMVIVSRRNAGSDGFNVVSGFPVGQADSSCRLELFDILADEDHGEADLILLMRNGNELRVFDPFYVLHRTDLQVGQQYRFALSALAYSLEKADRSFTVKEGPMLDEERRRVAGQNPRADVSKITSVEISMEECRYVNNREGLESDVEFFMKADSVDWFTMDDIPVCLVTGFVTHGENGRPIRLAVYATDHALKKYVPSPGDLLNGTAWLQGIPQGRMRQTEKWADRVLPNSPSAFRDAYALGEKAEALFPGAHPGILAAVHALGCTGWDIEPVPLAEPIGYGRGLIMRRSGRAIHVYLRAYHAETEQDCSFSTEDRRRLSLPDHSCVFVTVRCEEAGTHLRLSFSGHEPIEEHTGPLRFSTHVPKVK